jgi:hypothetical protein
VFDPDYLSKPTNWNNRVGEAFRWSAYTPQDLPIYKRLALWKLAARVKDLYLSRQNTTDNQRVIVQDAQLRWLEEARRFRRERQSQFLAQAKLQTLPAALDSYESVLARIVREIRSNGSKPILMTQAVQTRFSSDEQIARLWMGVLNEGEGHVSEEQYPAVLEQYNQRMRNVAREHNALLIDLAAELEPGPRPYYDGIHFNEWGAAEAAKLIAKFFVQEKLLSQAD